jgi:CRP-like cAMP-binding protein
MQVPCTACQLRQKALFRQLDDGELAFVASMKTAHVSIAPKVDVARVGEVGGTLSTLFGGWAFRYKQLPDGKRQILGFLLPGDLIGLESVVLGSIQHSVQTLTPASLCVLGGRSLADLFALQPKLGLTLLRTLVDEQRRSDERAVLLGHKDGPQRLGYLMLETFDRLHQRGMANGTWCAFPIQRQQLADALGLSRTHLIRSLAELQSLGLATVANNMLFLHDRDRLAALSGYHHAGRFSRQVIL